MVSGLPQVRFGAERSAEKAGSWGLPFLLIEYPDPLNSFWFGIRPCDRI
jgi:hypothetical protein